MKIRLPKKILLKLAFGLVAELILRYAESQGKYYADELRELIEEIRNRESV
jgi:hypothetical protein